MLVAAKASVALGSWIDPPSACVPESRLFADPSSFELLSYPTDVFHVKFKGLFMIIPPYI